MNNGLKQIKGEEIHGSKAQQKLIIGALTLAEIMRKIGEYAQ